MLFQLHFTNQFHCCYYTLVYPEPEGLPESSSGSEIHCQCIAYQKFPLRHQLLLLKQKVSSATMSLTFHFNYIPIFMEVEVLL